MLMILKHYSKINHFKDKIIKQNTIKEDKKIFDTWRLNFDRFGNKSITLTNTPRKISLQDFNAHKSNYIFRPHETALVNYKMYLKTKTKKKGWKINVFWFLPVTNGGDGGHYHMQRALWKETGYYHWKKFCLGFFFKLWTKKKNKIFNISVLNVTKKIMTYTFWQSFEWNLTCSSKYWLMCIRENVTENNNNNIKKQKQSNNKKSSYRNDRH